MAFGMVCNMENVLVFTCFISHMSDNIWYICIYFTFANFFTNEGADIALFIFVILNILSLFEFVYTAGQPILGYFMP